MRGWLSDKWRRFKQAWKANPPRIDVRHYPKE